MLQPCDSTLPYMLGGITLQRRCVDHTALVAHLIKCRLFQAAELDAHSLTEKGAASELLPQSIFGVKAPAMACTHFQHMSLSKDRSSINAACWLPDGRRLLTASAHGMFTLWSAFSFLFEATQQAHEHALHVAAWSHTGRLLLSADAAGVVKYWDTTLSNVKEFDAHPGSPIYAVSFCPTDGKFVSGADDGTVRVWDTSRAVCERLLPGANLEVCGGTVRSHRWDVKCVEWHPDKAIVASGSKDQSIKLWDPKMPREICSLHLHKGAVSQIRWHANGRYLLSSSRDQAIKLFDIRAMREVSAFRAHKREVSALAWHPVHPEVFVSGCLGGSVLFWTTATADPVAAALGTRSGGIPTNAHESAVNALLWHPLGHLLASASQDTATKFWHRVCPCEPHMAPAHVRADR